MFVTQHALRRLRDRLPEPIRQEVVGHLWAIPGRSGTQVYLVRQLPEYIVTEDGSNGNLVFAVAVDGSVETVYIRRNEQDNSPAFFGAERVWDCITG